MIGGRRLVWTCIVGAMIRIAPAEGQSIVLDTLSLYGLPGVRVAVDFVGADPEGLSGDTLQGDIEVAVGAAGIPVLTEDEWQVTIGNPMLRLRVTLVRPSEHFYLFNLELEVQQLTKLARDSTIPSFSTTWAAGDVVGTVPAGQLGSVRRHVQSMVAQFLTAHAVANRAPPPWKRAASLPVKTGGELLRVYRLADRVSRGWPKALESSSKSVSGSTETLP